MRNQSDKPLITVGLVVLFSLLLPLMPPVNICGVKMRRVSLLSDLWPSPALDGTPTVVPCVKVPAPQPSITTKADTTSYRITWPNGVQPIADYGAGTPNGMTHIYEMLDKLFRHQLSGRPVRIALFSDSYTEGDILAGHLRELLQQRYGGQGVGWVDAANDVNQFRLTLECRSHGLTEHAANNKNDYVARYAGLSGRYYPFNGLATLNLKSYGNYPHANSWTVCRLYLCPKGRVSVAAAWNGGPQHTQTASGTQVAEVTTTSPQPAQSLYITVNGAGTAFGASLEGNGGIVLDNFSMRSSSGTHLAAIPEKTLRQFQRLRHYDLVVVAFGGNAISPDSGEEDVEWYIKAFRPALHNVQRAFSDASILLTSMPDRGVRQGSRITTLPAVPLLVSAQARLAAECKVAFYDLFAAMGGEGSAGRLFNQKMVGADLFHPLPRGGNYIATRFYRSLVAGQEGYSHHIQAQTTKTHGNAQ